MDGDEQGRQRQRRSFSREFKLEALRVLDRGEKPAAQLARELGIQRGVLLKWRDQLRQKGNKAFCGSGRRPESERSEIARLKRELKRVTEERDILKKAEAYFAKQRR